ncbi:ThiF family adenylyltransferase [Candidatus Parcubacteria bacterium]|nr:ThiF family adenylyltransferase [Candidatus Parcubacteria bacterium]
MRYGVAFTDKIHFNFIKHLLRDDGQEDLCFGLWNPGYGKNKHTAIVYKVIYPKKNERKVHGNVGFLSNYLERVIGLALKENAGIAFLHSHPHSGWQNMSYVDKKSEERMAKIIFSATDLPLIGLTSSNNEIWSARFWIKSKHGVYKKHWCESVKILGNSLIINYNENLLPLPRFKEELRRTFSAWGHDKQSNLMRLKVGIVGLGSVGSIVAESLARMGVANIKLIDFDYIKRKNLDRCLHANSNDIGKLKTEIVAESISKSATADNFKVLKINYSIVEEKGFREALDCDILFSCVDRPWARQVLNFIAYSYLIPVIDGGIIVGTNKDKTDLTGADWKAHIASPGRRCLECLNQFNSSVVSAEMNGKFEDLSYINSLDDNHVIKRNENVFAFSLSLASMEIMQLLSMVINPCGVSNVGRQNYHFVTGKMDVDEGGICNNDCPYTQLIAKGDNSGVKLTGKDLKAEKIRSKYLNINKNILYFTSKLFNKFIKY